MSEQSVIRRWPILAMASGLLVALGVVAAAPVGSATSQEPEPVSCIVDKPVDVGSGFLLSRGKFTTIDHPDAELETAAWDINSRGQIVGGYDIAGVFHGFLLDRGRYEPIDFPGASRTIAARINARGQILGNYEDSRGGCHGFLRSNGLR
jgi:hypothetical protein